MFWLCARRVIEETRIASNALLQSPSLCRVGRWPLRPVLKHGPRSLTRARGVGQYETRKHSEGKRGEILLVGASPADPIGRVLGVEQERACWDPKDGELCLNRLKPEETLVEGRSGSDVQIDRRIWA